jgi:hypothetical protein
MRVRQLAATIMILFTLALFACRRQRPTPVTMEGALTPLPTRTPRKQETPLRGERPWPIPGGVGTTHELTGTLEPEDGGQTTLSVQVDGLAPGSPSSSSRSVSITLSCVEQASLRWRYESSDPETQVIDCGEVTSLYFSYDDNARRIQLRALQPLKRAVNYTFQATVHSPY